jgi:hypothetical protein
MWATRGTECGMPRPPGRAWEKATHPLWVNTACQEPRPFAKPSGRATRAANRPAPPFTGLRGGRGWGGRTMEKGGLGRRRTGMSGLWSLAANPKMNHEFLGPSFVRWLRDWGLSGVGWLEGNWWITQRVRFHRIAPQPPALPCTSIHWPRRVQRLCICKYRRDRPAGGPAGRNSNGKLIQQLLRVGQSPDEVEGHGSTGGHVSGCQ